MAPASDPVLRADGDDDRLGPVVQVGHGEAQAVEKAVGEAANGAERGGKVGQGSLREQGASQARGARRGA